MLSFVFVIYCYDGYMSLEGNIQHLEQNSSRKKLEGYLQKGKYLFHGSPAHNLSLIEPHQAFSGGKEDGGKQVFASDNIDLVIAHAIFTKANQEVKSHFGYSIKEHVKVKLTKQLLDYVLEHNPIAFVYVLSKDSFLPKTEEKHEQEFVSSEPVSIIDKVPVHFKDFQGDIVIVSDNK